MLAVAVWPVHVLAQSPAGQPRQIPEPVASAEEVASSQLEYAVGLQKSGDFESAEAVLVSILMDFSGEISTELSGNSARELMFCRMHLGNTTGAAEAAGDARDYYANAGQYADAADVMSLLGGFLRAKGNYALAKDAFTSAFTFYETLDDRPGKASALLSLGITSDLLGQLEEAAAYFEQARLQYAEIGDDLSVALCFRNQAYAMFRLGEFDEAIAAYQQSLYIYEILGMDELTAMAQEDLATAYFAIEDWAAALAGYQAASDLCLGMSDTQGLARCYLGMGKIHQATGDLETALQSIESSWALSMADRDLEALEQVLPLICELLKQLGNPEAAQACRDELAQLRQLIGNGENQGGY